jgi:protein-disulfide isomerase
MATLKRQSARALGSILIVASTATPAFPQGADPGALLNRIEALENAVQAIQKQLVDLNTSLRGQRTAKSTVEDVPPFILSIANAASRGSVHAKVVVVEFSDFQCPYCKRHAREVYPELLRQFVDTGEVRYVLRNLPIEGAHPQALKAAESAECIREQGKYWEMHDRLFSNQHALSLPDLIRYATETGADARQLNACLEKGAALARVKQDQTEARRLGIAGTPTFLLGEIDGDNVRVTRKIVGAQPITVFQSALEAILASSPSVK